MASQIPAVDKDCIRHPLATFEHIGVTPINPSLLIKKRGAQSGLHKPGLKAGLYKGPIQ